MKYFLDTETNKVFAFESDGSQDYLITEAMVSITSPPSVNHVWVDGVWALPVINHEEVTKLQLKRKLDTIIENGSSLWVQLKSLMQTDEDLWDEWLIASNANINDPMAKSAYLAMGKDKVWMQNLFNEIIEEEV